MLVANPGQTGAYTLHANKSSTSLCHTANKNNATSANNISSTSSVINSSSKLAATSLGLKTARHVLANNCLGTETISTKALPFKIAPTTVDTSTISKLHTNPSTTNSTNNQKTTTATTTTSINCSSSSYSSNNTTSSSNALMKTLSVRLNRGTEFLKETVHKALISKIPSHLSSVLNLNLYTVAPTVTHRFPAERVNASSADSLQTEMCHFKPIRTAPTTPWKCNSKSRGASLKMPKACVATKVKLDCYDATGEGTSLEAEGFLQFRPKPNSTLLTTIFTTPSRQSAFVCLVTQMKLNTSMKNKQASSTKQKSSRTKTSRSRTKAKDSTEFLKSNSELGKLTLSSKRNLRKRNVRSPFVNVQQMDLASELMSRSNLRKRTNSSSAAVGGARTKSKSKSKLSESLSLCSNDQMGSQRRLRKRKLYSDDSCNPRQRKSARLSKDCSMGTTSSKNLAGTGIRSQSYARLARRPSPIVQQKRPWSQFSPPLTRSRLKQLSEQKLNENQVL